MQYLSTRNTIFLKAIHDKHGVPGRYTLPVAPPLPLWVVVNTELNDTREKEDLFFNVYLLVILLPTKEDAR